MTDRKKEREFIHEIANPIGTVALALELILEKARRGEKLDPDEVAQLEKALNSINRVKESIKERRVVINSEENEKWKKDRKLNSP